LHASLCSVHDLFAAFSGIHRWTSTHVLPRMSRAPLAAFAEWHARRASLSKPSGTRSPPLRGSSAVPRWETFHESRSPTLLVPDLLRGRSGGSAAPLVGVTDDSVVRRHG
jgi:hypothetical protein